MAEVNIESGRDRVREELLARETAAKDPQGSTEKENIASGLFVAFTDLAKLYLPHDERPKQVQSPNNPIEEELSRVAHEEFMAAIIRRKGIEDSNHFLNAKILENNQELEVRIQMQPIHGNSLEALSEFRISLPDSKTTKDVFVIREKAAWVEPSGESFTEETVDTLINLLSYLDRPTTRIDYRRQPKRS